MSILCLYDKKSRISPKSRTQRFVILRECSLGDYSYVGYSSNIYNASIGKFCSISKEVSIGLPSHPVTYTSTSPIFVNVINGTGHTWSSEDIFRSKPDRVDIGSDVWIGMKSTVMGGVKIGTGAIVAAQSVVTKDVPPYAIVGGVPAKIIKYRFDDATIGLLLQSKWWEQSDEFLKKNIHLFQHPLNQGLAAEILETVNKNSKHV